MPAFARRKSLPRPNGPRVAQNPDDLLKSSPALPLAAINDQHPEGKQLLASAKHILVNLGKGEATAITLEDTSDTAKIFIQTNFNGDGIVPVESATDDATKGIINDIITCLGPEIDRSGKPGVSQAKVDFFFAESQAYSDWWKKAESDATVLPLGDKTAGAAAALSAVKAKVNDYFARCRLAAFDPRAINALNREGEGVPHLCGQRFNNYIGGNSRFFRSPRWRLANRCP